jgi:serine O-acetyltransferase
MPLASAYPSCGKLSKKTSRWCSTAIRRRAIPGRSFLLIRDFTRCFFTASLTSRGLTGLGRFFTGIEIHPGAKIGRRFFIDHGMGVVVGETAEIGNDVTIYQGVTLGGTSLRKEKRHPTVEDWVVVGAGATVLGPVTIGHNSRIGSGSVVVNAVPPHSTVVGIPGRVVEGEIARHEAQAHIIDLDHARLPDPVAKAIGGLVDYIQKLEKRIDELHARQGGLEEKTAEENEVLNKVKELLRNTGN